MPTMNQEQAFKLQGEFLDLAMKSAQALREGKPLSPEVLQRDGKEQLAAAKARLEAATKERDEMARRMDERVARLADEVKRLESALDDLSHRVPRGAPKPRQRKGRGK